MMDCNRRLEFERLLRDFERKAWVYGECLNSRHTLAEFDIAAKEFVNARQRLWTFVCALPCQ